MNSYNVFGKLEMKFLTFIFQTDFTFEIFCYIPIEQTSSYIHLIHYTSFAVRALVSWWTRAHAWRCAVTAIHTIWITKCFFTMRP